MLRLLLWRMLGTVAFLAGIALVAWLLAGGPGAALRGTHAGAAHLTLARLMSSLGAIPRFAMRWSPLGAVCVARLLVCMFAPLAVLILCARLRARTRRRYVRMRVHPYRTDVASAEAVVTMFETLHRRLQRRWWRRLFEGQPSVALEAHHADGSAWLTVSCPVGCEGAAQTALRTAYPNCGLSRESWTPDSPASVLRLKKHAVFIKRAKALDRFEHEREPAMNRLLTVLGVDASEAFVQVVLTPTPVLFEYHAKRLYKRHEARLSEERRDHLLIRDRSLVDDSELRGGLAVQHRPLFFLDLRVIAADRERCAQIAAELRAGEAENRLVERGTAVRHGVFGLYTRRVQRGEGNPLPSFHTGVFASTELAALWHLPSSDYATVPLARSVLPVAPAPPAILRPVDGRGTLRDALGPVSIHPEMRRQNTAVPGAVEQGKSSYLVATVAEDLRRERCAVIVLDPKGDAAEAAVSHVPEQRTCTLLDLAHPTCGFNPLAVDAPADVIADYVVAALKQLFTDTDIRASSDRYLRNAIIAVLAHDRAGTLWDAARLLSVGEEGYAYRARVGAHVRALPELKEISEFFTAELSVQLADARGTTTAKLDAPVNKLARLLNSPSIKRVLLNDSLRVDFDRVIAEEEVLIVKGALGGMGAGNTSVLMQLLVGMLDAALARQQDLVPEHERVTVALKVDEAPLVLGRGFAETMALKRSAGLETVACWQTESQWTEPEVRDQLDALFAHRVYFATASVRDARAAVGLTMAEFSDTVRPGIAHLAALGRPDARLHLPRHHAIVSWSTPKGRQSPFVAETIPLRVCTERVAFHTARQSERGGRYLADLRQPHWDRGPRRAGGTTDTGVAVAANATDLPADALASPDADDRRGGGDTNPESYRELVSLDGAHSARRAEHAIAAGALDPDQLDLEILALVASMRHLLSSQIHRHFNPTRAVTTTQRRLKRLADAGLLGRFQLHRRDGGGIPMCCVATTAGMQLLRAHGRLAEPPERDIETLLDTASPLAPLGDGSQLRQVRHDLHVAGWALAVACVAGGAWRLRGARESVLSPPLRSTSNGRVALGPGDLLLPGGRVPHEFQRTDSTGRRVPVERFETVRPDATVELCGRPGAAVGVSAANEVGTPSRNDAAPVAVDLLIELDDRLAPGPIVGKLERYDHLLAGWSAHTRRYGWHRRAELKVVFVCRDRSRARECARRADPLLGACRAYAGEYPADWEYPGREGILFVAERDMHAGCLRGYGVPRLPPPLRTSIAHGDPRAGELGLESRTLPITTHGDRRDEE